MRRATVGRARARDGAPARHLAPSLLLLFLAAAPAVVDAAPAKHCIALGARDALLAVHLQNDFFDARAMNGAYAPGASLAYPLDASYVHGENVRRGALAVRRAEEVVPVANAWMRAVDRANGSVVATLDWHPPDHCSFCKFGAKQSRRLDCVWGCEGTNGICVTGAGVPAAVFDSTGRCADAVSESDFQQSRYFQWPRHCVAGTFGSRFDPYLNVPERAVRVHAGVEQSEDSYSAFGGRRIRADGTRGASLLEILRKKNAKRVFVLGLATDYVVKETLRELLKEEEVFDDDGYNATTMSGKEDGTSTVAKTKRRAFSAVLIAAGSRGVFDAPGSFYGSDPESLSGTTKRDLIALGVSVVGASSVEDAMRELCEGTCDDDHDCVDGDGGGGGAGKLDEKICVDRGGPHKVCVPKPKVIAGVDARVFFSVALAGVLGIVVVAVTFRGEIVSYVSNRAKRKGPPTDFVVLVETDIEGSSELWETMSAAGLQDVMKDRIMGTHDEVLRRNMKKHYGYELFVRGDAFVVAFHEVKDALSWCLRVQLDLMASDWPEVLHDATAASERVWGTYEGLRVRMGVHCGVVDSATKHQGKLVYEGEVTRQVTRICDAGHGGAIIMSQATLPLPLMMPDDDVNYVTYDQGLHAVKDFSAPQRLKEVYPEKLMSRAVIDHKTGRKLDTETRLSPSFHDAPKGLVTMIYCHADGLGDLKKALAPAVVDAAIEIMAETLRACMQTHEGYDCRGHEKNGENMYVFKSYVNCALFAVEAQKKLHEAAWPKELIEHQRATDDAAQGKRVAGLRVKMGMHSGQLKRIRIPNEGLADYYGESANRAARVMSTATGGQVVCVASELEYFLDEHTGVRPKFVEDPIGTFQLKGIPGATALVQLALDEDMAALAARRFTEGKKATLITPGAHLQRVVHEAVRVARQNSKKKLGVQLESKARGWASNVRRRMSLRESNSGGAAPEEASGERRGGSEPATVGAVGAGLSGSNGSGSGSPAKAAAAAAAKFPDEATPAAATPSAQPPSPSGESTDARTQLAPSPPSPSSRRASVASVEDLGSNAET